MAKAKAAPKVSKRDLLQARDAKIVSDYKGGAEVPALASKNTLSEVRIYRILAANGVTLRPKAKADKPGKKAATKKAAKPAAKKVAKKTKGVASKPAPLGIPKSQSTRKAAKPAAK